MSRTGRGIKRMDLEDAYPGFTVFESGEMYGWSLSDLFSRIFRQNKHWSVHNDIEELMKDGRLRVQTFPNLRKVCAKCTVFSLDLVHLQHRQIVPNRVLNHQISWLVGTTDQYPGFKMSRSMPFLNRCEVWSNGPISRIHKDHFEKSDDIWPVSGKLYPF